MISEYFSLAGKNIRRRKIRSWLTMIGIVISIATIFMLISVSLGLNASIQEQFRALGTDKFFIMPKGQLGGPGTSSAVHLTSDDINIIKKVPGVKDYSYMSVGSAKLEFVNQVRFIMIAGVPLNHMSVFTESGFIKPEVGQGSFLNAGDVQKVMVGSQYLHNNVFKQPVHVGSTIKINTVDFRVKSVIATQGNPTDDKNIYMSLNDFEALFPERKNIYDEIIVQVDSGADVKTVASRVEKELIRSRGVTAKTVDFTILTPEQLLATFGTVLNILTGFLLGVAGISLIVGGIGITNTMYTSIIERTKEIGVMKAVGATNFDIIALFSIESGLLGLIGGAGGVILGFLIGKAAEFIVVNQLAVTMFAVSTPFWLFLACLAFSFAIGIISGIVPSYNAAHIKPVDALRYE